MKHLRTVVVIVTFVALSFAQESPRKQSPFFISGYVFDTQENLVASAEVHASPADRGGLQSMSFTQAGRFTLSVDGPGRYWVYAFKNDEGYRQISEALIRLDPESIPEVTVVERLPKSVTIRMRPSAATLTLRFVNSLTGQPIEKAQLTIRREDNPNRQYTKPLTKFDKKGEIKLLIPSLPIKLDASAPGYEDWSYSESGSGRQVLLLAPNEIREITIAMRPVKKS